jgi:hypothetical protein
VTDPTNPSAPKIPRKKPRSEPATIDLPSQVVVEAGPEPSASEAELAREAVAIEMGAPAETAGKPEPRSDGGGTPPSGAGGDSVNGMGSANGGPGSSRRPPSLGPIVAAALLGGVVGAGLLFALQDFRSSPDDTRVTALEQRVASIPPGNAQAGAVQALTARIQAIEAARTASDQRVAAAQAAAEQALNKPAAAPQAQDQAAIADLARRLSDIENQLQSNQQASAEARTSLATRVEDLSRRVSQGPEDATGATARMVLAQRVAESLRLGTPYSETLQALRANGADAARLSALEPFAEKGAPTASALSRSFEPLGAAILRDDRATAGSLTDRLLRMADKVVSIRPLDQPGSTDVTSLVARIEQALERGNVQEAVSAWENLPEPARRLSGEWAARAQARAAADAGAQAIASQAIEALNRPAQ